MSLLDLKIEVVLNEEHPVKKYCGTGTHMHIYDVDGTRLSLPPVHAPGAVACANRFGPRAGFQQRTRTWWIRNAGGAAGRDLCPTCYGFNYKLSGDPAIRDPVLCRMFQVQLLENCRFHAVAAAAEGGPFSREDCQRAKAVLKIHQNLTA